MWVLIFVGLTRSEKNPITSTAKFEQKHTFCYQGRKKAAKGRVGRGVCLANVVSKIQCASVTHPIANTYLPVYVFIHLHHLTCVLHINQNVKEVVTGGRNYHRPPQTTTDHHRLPQTTTDPTTDHHRPLCRLSKSHKIELNL